MASNLETIHTGLARVQQPKILLDWERHRLRIDGIEIGRHLNKTSWAFLTALAVIRPKFPGAVPDGEGVLPYEHKVNGTCSARCCRRELERLLKNLGLPGACALLVKNYRGLGYRLHNDIHIPRISEARVRSMDPQILQRIH